jgi:cupin 2 domain-containing protein
MNRSGQGSLFRNPPDATEEERIEELCQAKSFRVERIVSAGQVSPPGFWFDQPNEEWVLVVQGNAEISLLDPDETIRLSAGGWLMIEAHRKHRVEATSGEPSTIWLAIHGT